MKFNFFEFFSFKVDLETNVTWVEVPEIISAEQRCFRYLKFFSTDSENMTQMLFPKIFRQICSVFLKKPEKAFWKSKLLVETKFVILILMKRHGLSPSEFERCHFLNHFLREKVQHF